MCNFIVTDDTESRVAERGRFVPGTFSIAACDPDTDSFGVAVSTALVGVGALCPFVGENAAVATQSFVKVSHGKNAVELTDRGVGVETGCRTLIDDDEHASYRQLHGVDGEGGRFAFTGESCVDWCGDAVGDHHTVAGNMLENGATIEAMSETFEAENGDLSERLLTALEAAQDAGGDKRGKISAALLVRAPDPKLYHNLRVDDSDDPVVDLREAYELAHETERTMPESTEEMLGNYPEEITDFGLKY
jgi:uncharacterized Ntn-hydrolase superfamily protein